MLTVLLRLQLDLVENTVPHDGAGIVDKALTKRFSNIDGAMLAACTADADGQVMAVLRHVLRQPLFDEGGDVVDHFLNKWLLSR